MGRSEARLSGKSILVVEDQFFLADDLACALRAQGACVVGPVAEAGQGIRLLESQWVDLAVMDIKLRDGDAYALAAKLAQRSIPFLFASAYETDLLPSEFRAVPKLTKPVEARDLIAAVVTLLEPA